MRRILRNGVILNDVFFAFGQTPGQSFRRGIKVRFLRIRDRFVAAPSQKVKGIDPLVSSCVIPSVSRNFSIKEKK